MNRYTIYCTETQTKKALKLGAPITTHWSLMTDDWIYTNPPSEEMIGWLEKQGIYINLDTTPAEDEYNNLIIKWEYFIYNHYHDIINKEFIEYSTRKEATFAAIDMALEYLNTKS